MDPQANVESVTGTLPNVSGLLWMRCCALSYMPKYMPVPCEVVGRQLGMQEVREKEERRDARAYPAERADGSRCTARGSRLAHKGP